ncbi:hypothetical protein K2X33_08275, partial [bacterium]|nr:hypothetical protein [bacterium]
SLLEKGSGAVEKLRSQRVAAAVSAMQAAVGAELGRLKALDARNGLVGKREVAWWAEREKKLAEAFSNARVRLDSFLLIAQV